MNVPSRTLAPLITLVALLTLTACAPVGPSYKPPAPAMPAHWTGATPSTSESTAPPLSRWWHLFQDPALDRLVTRALAANLDLAIAETRIREARAQRQATAAGSLPQAGALASVTSSRTEENTPQGKTKADLLHAGFDASWELDLLGGVRRATEAAEAQLAATVEDKRDAQVVLIAEIARHYIELRGNQRRLAIARDSIRLQEQTVAMVRKRFQIGLGNELEAVQAENQLALTASQVPALREAMHNATTQLAILLAQAPGTLEAELAPETAIPVLPPRLPVMLPSELLRQRPDIRRAERQLALATAEVGVAEAELFPKFSLTALIGLENTSLSQLITSGSRFWSAGPRIRWSLFDGGRIRAGIEAADSRRERAHLVYEKTVLSALGETEQALVALAREQETRDLLTVAVRTGGEASELAKKQYAIGLVPFLNVLQGELASFQSQERLAQSEQRLALNMVALYKSLGGGWVPDETRR